MVARVGRVSSSKAGGTGAKQFGWAWHQDRETSLQSAGCEAQGYLRETETWDLSPGLSGEVQEEHYCAGICCTIVRSQPWDGLTPG